MQKWLRNLRIGKMNRNDIIEFLRANGFNCFPVPLRPGEICKNWKKGDKRFDAERTPLNQEIKDNENYGVVPIKGAGTCIIDFDSEDEFRKGCEQIAGQFFVVKSPHGFHVYVMGLTTNSDKVELFKPSVQEKKIVEIQGHNHFCMGPGSIIDSSDEGHLEYQLIGKLCIMTVNKRFDDFVDDLCDKVGINRNTTREQNYQMRKRFAEGKIPSPGTSNSFYYNASLWCNSPPQNYTKDEATKLILENFEKYKKSSHYRGRSESDVLRAIDTVYDNDHHYDIQGGRPKGATSTGIDRVEVAEKYMENRQFYSSDNLETIYENKKGFLEDVTFDVDRELMNEYDIKLEKQDVIQIKYKIATSVDKYSEIKFNKDVIVFKNGIVDVKTKEFVEIDDIAYIGFKDYDYLPKTLENEPTEFIKLMFDNVPSGEHKRIKAGLRAILKPKLDARISVIHGLPRVGKSAGLTALLGALGQYGYAFQLEDMVDDKFVKAKMLNKLLIVLQELPTQFKGFTTIKTITGEPTIQLRGFHQDSVNAPNTCKFWASTNNLAQIPEDQKAPMYARFSLVHNTRKDEIQNGDSNYGLDLAEREGEKIISWILNLDDNDCEYETSQTVREEWEMISDPFLHFINSRYALLEDGESSIQVPTIRKIYEKQTGKNITIKEINRILTDEGYIVKTNKVENMKTIDSIKSAQDVLG